MEHLRRIIPKIGIIHGVPGAISLLGVARLYVEFLEELIPEKYREIVSLRDECIKKLSTEEILKNSFYNLFSRELLPAKILEKMVPFVPDLMTPNHVEFRGLYRYAVRKCSHVRSLDCKKIEVVFENTWIDYDTRVSERLPLCVDISLANPNYIECILFRMMSFRRYDLLDVYTKIGSNLTQLFWAGIPFERLNEYAKNEIQHKDIFVDHFQILIQLHQIVRRATIAIELGYHECSIPIVPKFDELPDFTFNAIARCYKSFPEDYDKPRYFIWQLEQENIEEIPVLESFSKSGQILNTGNIPVLQYCINKYPELENIGKILEIVDF